MGKPRAPSVTTKGRPCSKCSLTAAKLVSLSASSGGGELPHGKIMEDVWEYHMELMDIRSIWGKCWWIMEYPYPQYSSTFIYLPQMSNAGKYYTIHKASGNMIGNTSRENVGLGTWWECDGNVMAMGMLRMETMKSDIWDESHQQNDGVTCNKSTTSPKRGNYDHKFEMRCGTTSKLN